MLSRITKLASVGVLLSTISAITPPAHAQQITATPLPTVTFEAEGIAQPDAATALPSAPLDTLTSTSTYPAPMVSNNARIFLPLLARAAAPPTPTATRTSTRLPTITRTPSPTRTPTNQTAATATRTSQLAATATRTATSQPSATNRPLATATNPPILSPSNEPVTADSTLLSTPRATVEQMVADILARPHGEYTEADVRLIVGYYDRFGREVGLDPLLAVAQMIHETGNITSFWAARPRRNPAGIGVTGQSSATPPADQANWSYDPARGMWYYGVSFPSWEVSVRAQLGRLLAYALTDAQATPAQRALITEALNWRAFPDRLRGTAPTLKPLGAVHNPTGSGWANPGDNYGSAIASIANRIKAR